MSTATSTYAAAYHRAQASARAAERKRVLAILALPEARTRWQFAVWIATMTDATPDEARHRLRTDGIAGGAPAEQAPSALVDAMRARFAGQTNLPSPSSRPTSNVSAAPGGLAAAMRTKFATEPTHA